MLQAPCSTHHYELHESIIDNIGHMFCLRNTPPPCIPGSVMFAERVKDSVPSTRKFNIKTSMTTEMGPRVLEPRSNVTSFIMR